MPRWDPRRPLGGNSLETLRAARLILWRGWCSVHARFTVAQIEQARRDHPGINVIVHPECRREVVEAADRDGSTELILETISSAPPGSRWAVGTEINMVNRLAAEHPDKLIFCLDPVICPCSTMYRIHPAYLAWVLEALVDGQVLNEIVVPERVKASARVALDRMLSLPARTPRQPAEATS
jgi:quinolinate synthase